MGDPQVAIDSAAICDERALLAGVEVRRILAKSIL
jgi:hypothetical protein